MLTREAVQLALPTDATRDTPLSTTDHLLGACAALGAASFGGPLSEDERRLIATAVPTGIDADGLRSAILGGEDPLGELLYSVHSLQTRRRFGAFYTPSTIVRSMVAWALGHAPTRLVDPGCGSGRFTAEAIRRSPDLEILAIDIDPMATLACRAVAAVFGAGRARVIHGDYTALALNSTRGRTAFVGNPPYVRHHSLSAEHKMRAKEAALRLGLKMSGLAGLHAHFFVSTLAHARQGDVGCFITSSEWLDVGYGSVVREALLNGLGGISMHLLQPESMTFEGVMTTAIISCFEVGATPPLIGIRNAQSPQGLRDLGSFERHVSRSQLEQASRWTPLFRESPGRSSERRIRLGEIVRVSRGAVTGANDFFVLDPEQAQQLGLMPHVKPALTRAQEVFASDGLVRLNATRRLLLDPARHVDLSAEQNLALGRHLIRGERQGIPAGYICRHRTPWWHVGAKAPPIVATYMARQPPAFALNPDGMAILNVLHGLFPRVELDQHQLLGLVRFLNSHRAELRGAGRMYQGGLEKFEPREMEALEIPLPDRLRDYAGE